MKEKKEDRFICVYKQDHFMEGFEVIVDSKTGVNYVIIQHGNGSGITPLLDAFGQVVISSLPITKE